MMSHITIRIFTVVATFMLASLYTFSVPREKSISEIKIEKNLVYSQSIKPEAIDNYLYPIFFSNDKKIYNLKGFEIATAPMKIMQLKVNPAGHSVAVLVSNGKQSRVIIYDLNTQSHQLAQVKNFNNPTTIVYTSDSRQLAVVDGTTLHFLDSKKMKPQGSVETSFVPTLIEASPNSGLLVTAKSATMEVISSERKQIVRKINVGAPIIAMKFDPTGNKLGLITQNRKLVVFDGHTFKRLYERNLPLRSTSLAFHHDGKYVAVANNDNRITFLNLYDPTDTTSISDSEGSLREVMFIRDGDGSDYIAYTSPTALKYKRLSGFLPNYTKLLEDELNLRIAAWSKMKPFETEEEYATRVNELTKAKQKQLFSNEIATSLAGDFLEYSDVVLGDYNPENSLLSLIIGGTQNVSLKVPREEVVEFGDGKNIEFHNAVYGLTLDDKFELIYADVYNIATGTVYTFDNLERHNLDSPATGDSFISLDLIRQSGREDARLQQIKEFVLSNARNNSFISNHTNINVSADILSDYSDEGYRINNYKVDFTYTVDSDYSDTEDFPPGKYRISDSHAAESMLEIITDAFNNDFKQYLTPDKRLLMNITGTADALPILRSISYEGSFGEFENELCRIDGNLASISVDANRGIRTNDQLAFIRAQALRDNLLSLVPSLKDLDITYNYNIEVSKEKGAAYRRINVSFIFIDAF